MPASTQPRHELIMAENDDKPAPVIPNDLLEILVCPLGKEPLRLEEGRLVCTRCGAAYLVEDGIPNLLVDDAVLPEGVERVEDLACYSAEG